MSEERATSARRSMDARQFALLQAGLDRIDQGITIFDGALTLVFANERLTELLEAPPELLQPGVTFEQVIRFNVERGEYGPGDAERMVAERVARARRFEPHTLERVRPNGMVLRVSGWPLEDGGFATIYTDITDQRRREETLETLVSTRTADLRRNEERLRLIANEVPAGIAYIDVNQVFEFVNARFARAYRKKPEDLIGRSAPDVLSPETMAVANPHFERARQGDMVDFDHAIRLAGRPELEIRTFLRPDREPGDGAGGFYVLSVNVTKQKRAEATLATAGKMEAIGRLSSGVAHDFNNLLTVILGNLTPVAADLQAAGGEPAALADDMLEPAIRAARRGADLTRRLLALARRQPRAERPVELAEAVRAAGLLIEASLPETTTLRVETRAEAWAAVDPTELETALLNLAINARDAIPAERQGAIAISLDTVALGPRRAESLGVAPGSYQAVTVADNGVGVPQEAREQIFEPFFSTKSDQGGSGLGLALVYGFARDAGGHVTLDSAPGLGARFTLLLPATEPAARVAPPPETAPPALAGRLALLVDDDAAVRRVLTRALRDLHLKVIEAENAVEALELVDAVGEIELVLSDVAMPLGLSGVDLAERLAAVRPELPIVLMTAHGRDALSNTVGRFSGPVLRKPFDADALRAALGQAFERAHARGAAPRPGRQEAPK